MDKSIRVHVLGREYALRVQEEDEATTRDIAAYVDAKMQAFKRAHPEQPEITTAVITALAIAEELYAAWEEQDRTAADLEQTLGLLGRQLEEALAVKAPAPGEDAEEDTEKVGNPAADAAS